MTVVVAGHVDHGKSTITGHLIVATNRLDKREMRKITKEATAYGKESSNFAFVMDQNKDEVG